MPHWTLDDVHEIPLDEIGEHYARYRLRDEVAERAMENSMFRYGQISPVVTCLRDGQAELIDGFKRLAAARRIEDLSVLSARVMEADDRAAKAAIFCLNRGGGRTRDLEDAWIVHALVRDDGLTQVDVAELLGRHKSWVCRRLAMIEKLMPSVQEDLRLGLISPTVARQITRLPAGNQEEVNEVARRESLSSHELEGVVDLLLTSGQRSHQEFILEKPRQALAQAQGIALPSYDPRLSKAGNRVSKRLGMLLDQVVRMRNWIEHGGYDDLTASDRSILAESFDRLARDASTLGVLCSIERPGRWTGSDE